MHKSRQAKDDHLRKGLLVMEAFRAIRRTMPLQHAYAFLLIALEEGRSVSGYAKSAGITQAVMTRILFALSSRNPGHEPHYGLVQQVIDPQDGRRKQTFLTVRGEALMHEIVRLMGSDRQPAMKLRKLIKPEMSSRDLESNQWLSRLIEVGRTLGADDIQLIVRQVEALIGHRQSKKTPVRRRTSKASMTRTRH